MFWDLFNCWSSTCTSIQEEVFSNLSLDDCVSSCLTCGGLLEKNEWAGYNPDTDPYDPRTAVIDVAPESVEIVLKKQIEALCIRIGRGGDAQTLEHYHKVIEELENELASLPPTEEESANQIPMEPISFSKLRKESSESGGLASMSTGLLEYQELPAFSESEQSSNREEEPDMAQEP
eukprot:Skav225115  [mRNA]  locus=scaffold1459:80643:84081:+ [translate_table: standard]